MSQFHGDRITHTVQQEAEEGEEEGEEEGLYEEMEGEEEQLEEDVIGEEEIEHEYEEEEYYEDEEEENMHEEIEGKLDGSSKLNGHPVANKHTTSLSPIESAKIDFQANRILVSPNEARPNDSQSIGIRELKGSSTLERDKLAMNSKDHNIRLQDETLCRKNETQDHHTLNKNIEGPNNGRLSSPIDQNKDDSWGSIGEIEHQKRKEAFVFKNSEINSKNTIQNLSERKRPITLVKDGDFSLIQEKSKGDNLSNKSYEKSEQVYIPTIRPKLDDNKPSIQSKEITEDKNGGNNSLTMKPSLDFNGRNSPSNSGLMDNDSNYNKSTLKNPSKIHISDSRRFIPSSIKNFDADDKTFGPKRVPSRDLDNDSDQSGYKKDRHIGNRTDNVLQNSPSLRERDTFRMKTTLSKRSISNAEKEDMTQLTISPLLSRQPTLTMPPISKQPTPKASESTLRMEPVKALPILNSSAKQISSRETSPEANPLNRKGLQVSSIVTSPKYAPAKQKDPLVSLSKANLSKPQLRLSPVPTVNAIQEVNEMSRRPSLNLLDGPGHYPSSNGLAKFPPPTSKAVSEIESAQNKQFDRKVVQGGSQLSSRRSSKTQLAPIIGIHDNHFDTPKQMVSRQVGLGYSSLNHSKLDTSLLDRSLEIDRSAYSKANTSVSNDPASGLDSKSSPVLLLAKVKDYCATNNDSKFLTLSQLEHLNEAGENLRRQLAQISSPMKDQAGSILVRASDIKRPVSNYTKSTLNYIKSRYKRDMESNNLIADAMEKELARLSDLVQKISDPRYKADLHREVENHKENVAAVELDTLNLKENVHRLKLEVKNIMRKRTSAAEVGAIEKTLDQTVQIKKLLTEDIETLKKKLGQQGKLQSEIDQKVEEKVQLVKSMGLDNPTLLDMFDKLREFKFKIEKDTMSIQNHNRSQHKQVEEKIQKLKMMIEASTAEIVRLDRDAQVINDQMVSMNKLSSLKELKTIQLIAYKERQKIASLTGNVGILSDEIDLADTQAPIYDHRAEDIANMKMYYFKKHE